MDSTRHGPPPAKSFIHLENTAADLYLTESSDETPLYVPLFPSSKVDLAPGIARNQRYLLYESSYAEPEISAEPKNDLKCEKLRRTLSCRRLTDFGQNMIFAAGNMELIVVDPNLPNYLPDGAPSSKEYVR